MVTSAEAEDMQVGRESNRTSRFLTPTAISAFVPRLLVSSGRPLAPIPLASPSALSVRRRILPPMMYSWFYFFYFLNFCPSVVP